MSEEPKSTFSVWITSKIPAETYGTIEIGMSVGNDFPPFIDAETVKNWYADRRELINEILNQEEIRERTRRGLTIPERLNKVLPVQIAEKPEEEEIVKVIGPQDEINIETDKTEPKTEQSKPSQTDKPLRVIICKTCKEQVREYKSRFPNGKNYFRCKKCGYLDEFGNKEIKKV